MELLVKKKEIVSTFLKNNILVGKDVLDKLGQPSTVERWHAALMSGVNPVELLKPESKSPVKIVWDYDDQPKKRKVQDFVDYFNARFRSLERLLHSRAELQNLTSIGRLRGKAAREKVSIIGMISDKRDTKNGHIIVKLEDNSGTIDVLFSKNKPDLLSASKDIVFDEVIGVNGVLGEGIVFADSFVIPDIPISEIKKAKEEGFAAVLSCVHVGSERFEHERFDNFVKWANGVFGSQEQKEMAKKLKYIFICGDLVDGVGIYPGQDSELSIKDIRSQYVECARLLSLLPKDVNIIVAPGNHDAGRISEPQPALSKEYAQPLWDLPNVTMVCNPCVVNVDSSSDFSGFDVLMYHGYSFDDYAEIVPSIKNSGEHISDRATMIMKFLMQRRHLAPQHTSTLYIPDSRSDPLVIERVPDLFVAGHIHKAGVMHYRGVSLVCGSCFQAKTDFQEKVGHEPEPGVVPLIDLQTRNVTLMRF